MREREKNIAKHFGILERCLDLEKALLSVDGVTPEKSADLGIDFDLNSIPSELVIVPKYGIPVSADDYFDRRRKMLMNIIETCKQFGLTRSEDEIEDYGEHYYIVFRCDSSWKNK